MIPNPRKARSKKDTNPDPSQNDEALALDDEVQFITEIPAPKPEVVPVGDAIDDNDIFILEIHAPVGAYVRNLAHPPHPLGSRL